MTAGKVVIIGTLDTKGVELHYIKEIVEGSGLQTIVINAGTIGKPYFEPDISNASVAEAGGTTLTELIEQGDRGQAIDVMMKGSAEIVRQLFETGQVGGMISVGGSAGTTVGCYAMQVLPVGVPKIMVSTVASGDTSPYVGVKDITMMYSVVDISGLNRLSRTILANAAFGISGMVKGITQLTQSTQTQAEEKTLLGATMFGVTTACVTKAREYLEERGYEVLVFHATGSGGRAMEGLIESGYIKGVLDITTTEWCDELVGGVFGAGPLRLEAAGKAGIPQVVSVGALDMVNFGALNTVPAKFMGRRLYKHNPTITLMRTTREENRELGKIIAQKLNQTLGPTALFLPLKGVSAIDQEGQPFYGPEEDEALFQTLREEINPVSVTLVEVNQNINNEEFAVAMAETLIQMLEAKEN